MTTELYQPLERGIGMCVCGEGEGGWVCTGCVAVCTTAANGETSNATRKNERLKQGITDTALCPSMFSSSLVNDTPNPTPHSRQATHTILRTLSHTSPPTS